MRKSWTDAKKAVPELEGHVAKVSVVSRTGITDQSRRRSSSFHVGESDRLPTIGEIVAQCITLAGDPQVLKNGCTTTDG